jgi:hypothetical protein
MAASDEDSDGFSVEEAKEQEEDDAIAAAAAGAAGGAKEGEDEEEDTSTATGKRKRAPKRTEKAWETHIFRTDHHFVSHNNRIGHLISHCKYCVEAANEPTPEQKHILKTKGIDKPEIEDIRTTGRDVETHLSNCDYAPHFIRDAFYNKLHAHKTKEKL